jgi:general secretion pathway protein G
MNSNQSGFSLLEILIALTLLALAGTFVGGKMFESYTEGQISSTKIQMSGLEGRLKEFRRKCGFYPGSEQGLEALVTKPGGGRECKDYPPSGFIDGDQVPKDPWDHDFIYESDGKTFNIYSYGPDGQPGGDGNDADIYLKGGPSKGSSKAEAPAPAATNEAPPAQQE